MRYILSSDLIMLVLNSQTCNVPILPSVYIFKLFRANTAGLFNTLILLILNCLKVYNH